VTRREWGLWLRLVALIGAVLLSLLLAGTAAAQTPTPVDVVNQLDLANLEGLLTDLQAGLRVLVVLTGVSTAAALASVVAVVLGYFRG